MTVLKYLLASGVCTTSELLKFKREDPKGYVGLIEMARGEMVHNGVEVEEAKA